MTSLAFILGVVPLFFQLVTRERKRRKKDAPTPVPSSASGMGIGAE